MRTCSLFLMVVMVGCGESGDGQGRPGGDTAGGVDALTDVGFTDGTVPDPDGTLPDGEAPDGATPDATPPDTASPDTASPDAANPDLPPGTLDCKQFYQQCVSQCAKGADGQPDDACFAACHAQLSTEGRAVTDALIECVEQAGCDALTDAGQALTCFAGACSDQYFACFHGEQACKDVLTCMGGCPQGDTYNACVVTCSQDGTIEAQKQLIAILQCIGEACCPGDAAACGTEAGKQCSKDAVGLGGACFSQVSGCLMGL